MPQLMEMSPEWEEAVREYKKEFQAVSLDWEGTGLTDFFVDAQEFSGNEYVSSTYLYVREEDNKVLGLLNLRRGLSGEQLARIGNVGFSVCPSEQGKGYAVQMLRDAVFLSLLQGIVPWYMVCREDNTASKKVIARLGGRKQGEIKQENIPVVCERYVVYDVFS